MTQEIVWHLRDDTSDQSVINSTKLHDEYGIEEYEPGALKGWALDIGAHIGAVCIPLALRNPLLQVVAVEPVPDNVRLLRENIAANGLTGRIVVVHGAIASWTGQVGVQWNFKSVDGEDPGMVHTNRYIGNLFGRTGVRTDAESETVWATTLSTLLEDYDIGDVTWAKTDCEGGEWDLLADPAVSSLRYIIGEYHDRTEDDLYELLSETHEVTTYPSGAALGAFRAIRKVVHEPMFAESVQSRDGRKRAAGDLETAASVQLMKGGAL